MSRLIEGMRQVFTYEPATGLICANGKAVRGQLRWADSDGLHQMTYARASFCLHFGYVPRNVRFRNGDRSDTRAGNLRELYAYRIPQEFGLGTPYPGVYLLADGSGYVGTTYRRGVRRCTARAPTPERARDLRAELRNWLEYVSQHKGTAQ